MKHLTILFFCIFISGCTKCQDPESTAQILFLVLEHSESRFGGHLSKYNLDTLKIFDENKNELNYPTVSKIHSGYIF